MTDKTSWAYPSEVIEMFVEYKREFFERSKATPQPDPKHDAFAAIAALIVSVACVGLD